MWETWRKSGSHIGIMITLSWIVAWVALIHLLSWHLDSLALNGWVSLLDPLHGWDCLWQSDSDNQGIWMILSSNLVTFDIYLSSMKSRFTGINTHLKVVWRRESKHVIMYIWKEKDHVIFDLDYLRFFSLFYKPPTRFHRMGLIRTDSCNHQMEQVGRFKSCSFNGGNILAMILWLNLSLTDHTVCSLQME